MELFTIAAMRKAQAVKGQRYHNAHRPEARANEQVSAFMGYLPKRIRAFTDGVL